MPKRGPHGVYTWRVIGLVLLSVLLVLVMASQWTRSHRGAAVVLPTDRELLMTTTATNSPFQIFLHHPRDDPGCSAQLLDNRIFDSQTSELMQRFFESLAASGEPLSSSLFVDMGADLGYFSLLAAQYGIRVVAFEPVGSSASLFRRSIALNGLGSRIKLIEGFPYSSDSEGSVYDFCLFNRAAPLSEVETAVASPDIRDNKRDISWMDLDADRLGGTRRRGRKRRRNVDDDEQEEEEGRDNSRESHRATVEGSEGAAGSGAETGGAPSGSGAAGAGAGVAGGEEKERRKPLCGGAPRVLASKFVPSSKPVIALRLSLPGYEAAAWEGLHFVEETMPRVIWLELPAKEAQVARGTDAARFLRSLRNAGYEALDAQTGSRVGPPFDWARNSATQRSLVLTLQV